jgi:hypothetical protein
MDENTFCPILHCKGVVTAPVGDLRWGSCATTRAIITFALTEMVGTIIELMDGSEVVISAADPSDFFIP